MSTNDKTPTSASGCCDPTRPAPAEGDTAPQMQRVLFHDTIFGPVHSRRLGVSLGVNLTPDDGKICSFDCLYCEAGFNAQGTGTGGFKPRETVRAMLAERLAAMHTEGKPLDVITFSGNGEPTLHPDFAGVIDDTIELRDRYYPEAAVSVLSNATRLDRPDVCRALRRVDNNILKLDSALTATARLIDRPNSPTYTPGAVADAMAREFSGTCIVQTMMLRGTFGGRLIDNTTDAEVDALIDAYRRIRPREVMLYTIDRPTPALRLHKVPRADLDAIAARITAATNIPVQVSG